MEFEKIKIVLKDEKGGRVPRIEIPGQLMFEMLPEELMTEGSEKLFDGSDFIRYDVEVIG